MAEAKGLTFITEQDIPEATRNSAARVEIEGFVEVLAKNTGKWALVFEGLKPSTASAKARMLREYEGIETVVRNGGVYAAHKPAKGKGSK